MLKLFDFFIAKFGTRLVVQSTRKFWALHKKKLPDLVAQLQDPSWN